MNQYPQSPDVTGAQPQPPVYHQDPNAQYQQNQMYQQPQQQYSQAGSPHPQQPQGAYIQPQQTGHQQNPGMPPQHQSGTVYQNATPIASLNRGPAPADCPACGQRAMTNVSYEVGNTTHAWALGLCCLACLGCIPYVMNSLKDVQHKCGRCGVLLATWHRSGTTEVHIHS
ncbi:LITAF-like zinc ribbon domain-containing protein [Lophiotrema nucula]|uniref:LITAF-like zinc ribbon domain-containing protein n=1 Tax=Lophiotrema nucula TaxID=690887 RepID=A0A6A5Z9X8_9PLEO|nr:LITAF-like zinc ribbon domain-containing protein [Lophiotrema nucula]